MGYARGNRARVGHRFGVRRDKCLKREGELERGESVGHSNRFKGCIRREAGASRGMHRAGYVGIVTRPRPLASHLFPWELICSRRT